MHILILSWRDIKNPSAGGAEVLTHEICKRLVKKGHQVTIISGKFNNAKTKETIDRVQIIRPANFSPQSLTDYLHWPLFLKKIKNTINKLENQIDIIIDQVHGLPNFSQLYVKKPLVFFPLEVAREIWNYQVPFPGNLLGIFLENIYLRLGRNHQFITISTSTARDLKQYGINKIAIIKPGINPPPANLPKKTENPSFICLGRIAKMKRLEDSIKAFAITKSKYPKIRLHIIGKGPQFSSLKRLTTNLRLQNSITLHGFVNEKQKYILLSQSWALLSTSVREGWGLNVIEAAIVKTPTLAYKIPGIVDTVINNKTGLITNSNNPNELAKLMQKLIKDKKLRQKLGHEVKNHSRQYSWDKTTDEFLVIIKKTLEI